MTDKFDKPATTDADKPTKADAPKSADKNEGLVKVKLHGDTLFIHPDAVKAHEDAGWERA